MHKRHWHPARAALSRIKYVHLECTLKFEVRWRKHAVTIMTRNFRGLIGDRDRACTHVLYGPGCIVLFGYLKVINVEFGRNDDPVITYALAANNQGHDIPPHAHKKIRQWVKVPSPVCDIKFWLLPQLRPPAPVPALVLPAAGCCSRCRDIFAIYRRPVSRSRHIYPHQWLRRRRR